MRVPGRLTPSPANTHLLQPMLCNPPVAAPEPVSQSDRLQGDDLVAKLIAEILDVLSVLL